MHRREVSSLGIVDALKYYGLILEGPQLRKTNGAVVGKYYICTELS